jgi:hypothetical protein
LALISLPDELFYPTAAPTSLLIAKAHVPQQSEGEIFLGRITNDGFEKSKGRRVEIEGSEIPLILSEFSRFRSGLPTKSSLVKLESSLTLSNGAEWLPHEWLPQPEIDSDETNLKIEEASGSIFKAMLKYPDLSEKVDGNLENLYSDLPGLPYGQGQLHLSALFDVHNGKSSGEKNYPEGTIPYVSSGDLDNSIVNLVEVGNEEIFEAGAITVTAFGQASFQPWSFAARGNGGSSVRVLIPRYKMSTRELLWFVSQINLQKWRFFYARMAIKSRIIRLNLPIPPAPLSNNGRQFNALTKDLLDTYKKLQIELHGY